MIERRDALVGCLIGGAVGDSLLLPAEGLSRQRIARRFGPAVRQRLVAGRGMVSDDTEHAFLTARALIRSGDDPQRFARSLGWRLRWWMLCMPIACGKATALGIIRLWLGWPVDRSGVHSGGNGPSMRAAIIGAAYAEKPDLRRALVDASTSLTHRHPHARAAAQAVAACAAWSGRDAGIAVLWSDLADQDPDWQQRLDLLRTWLESDADTDELARRLDCPEHVSGWSLHSVPFAIGCWLRHRDDAAAGFAAVQRAGGDTDTIGAILGGLYGADRGESAFDPSWTQRLVDMPISTSVLRATAQALAGQGRPSRWWWPLLPLRNVMFLIIILAHVARRALP
jgi:ADP-ribosyl-[dinitrogen reductase] hydrolase